MPQPAHFAASMTGLRPLIAGQPSRPQAPQRRQRFASVSYVLPAPPLRSSAHSPLTIMARAPLLSALSAASMPFTSLAASSRGSIPQRRQSSAGSPPPFFSSTITRVPPVPASRRRASSVSSAEPVTAAVSRTDSGRAAVKPASAAAAVPLPQAASSARKGRFPPSSEQPPSPIVRSHSLAAAY